MWKCFHCRGKYKINHKPRSHTVEYLGSGLVQEGRNCQPILEAQWKVYKERRGYNTIGCKVWQDSSGIYLKKLNSDNDIDYYPYVILTKCQRYHQPQSSNKDLNMDVDSTKLSLVAWISQEHVHDVRKVYRGHVIKFTDNNSADEFAIMADSQVSFHVKNYCIARSRKEAFRLNLCSASTDVYYERAPPKYRHILMERRNKLQAAKNRSTVNKDELYTVTEASEDSSDN